MTTCEWITKGLRVEFTTIKNLLHYRTRPCCHMHGNLFDDEYKKWKICNGWEDLENHPNRSYFIDWQNNNNKLHKACYPCVKAEEFDTKNPRLMYKKNNLVDYHILDVVVGSTCNLACPFCAPNVSSLVEKIASQYSVKLPGKWSNEPVVNGDQKLVAKIVSEFIKNRRVGELKVIGGEPLLHDNWYEIGKVISSGTCSDMTLTFTTNGTVMNENIIDNLRKVKDSKITVSIDSIGKNYDFIRWPYSWDKVNKNIQMLLENKPSSAHVNVDGLVTIFNFELLPEIINDFERFPSYSFNFDLKPIGSELDFKVLSKDIIYDVYSKVNAKRIKNNIESVLDNYHTMNLNSKREHSTASVKWFLNQRQMDSSVLGSKTVEYLQL